MSGPRLWKQSPTPCKITNCKNPLHIPVQFSLCHLHWHPFLLRLPVCKEK